MGAAAVYMAVAALFVVLAVYVVVMFHRHDAEKRAVIRRGGRYTETLRAPFVERTKIVELPEPKGWEREGLNRVEPGKRSREHALERRTAPDHQ